MKKIIILLCLLLIGSPLYGAVKSDSFIAKDGEGDTGTISGSFATDRTFTLPDASGTFLLTDGDGSGLSGVVTAETDPNVDSSSEIMAIIGADGVQNLHINWDNITYLEEGGALPNDSVQDADINWDDLADLSSGGEVADDSHAHTTTTISGLDVSDDTNLAVSNPITLTDDTLGFNWPTNAELQEAGINWEGIANYTAGKVLTATTSGDVNWATSSTTVLKDLVVTSPLTGSTNDILPGSDADVTIGFNWDSITGFGAGKVLHYVDSTTVNWDTDDSGGSPGADSIQDSMLNWDDITYLGESGVLLTDALDTITDIAAALKSGADGTLITGTKGSENYLAKWDANGDAVQGDVKLGTMTDTKYCVYDSASDSIICNSEGGAGGSSAMNETLWPQSAKLPSSNACGIDGGKSQWALLFDADTAESCRWTGISTNDYQGGTLYADVFFSMASGEADEVQFRGYVMAYTAGTDSADIDTDSFDSANEGTATTVAATAGRLYKQTITLTNKDSLAAGDWMAFKLDRDATDATNDDATGDAEVRGIIIHE